jgi:hypothetical protein
MKNIELDYIPNTLTWNFQREKNDMANTVSYYTKIKLYIMLIYIMNTSTFRIPIHFVGIIAKKLKVKPESLEFIETVPNQKMTKVIQSYLKKVKLT